MTTARCPTCDREIAGADSIGEGKCEVQVSFDSKRRRAGGWNLQANRDCEAHRVDWRARALAAEAERSEILGLVNPSSDQSVADRVRELIEDLCEAQADAARWRKVAPLIERLADDVRRRELIARAEFDRRVSDTVTDLLAATREPTP